MTIGILGELKMRSLLLAYIDWKLWTILEFLNSNKSGDASPRLTTSPVVPKLIELNSQVSKIKVELMLKKVMSRVLENT